MNPLRTVGGRLAFALLLVVGAALAIVYIGVVPSYQRSLVNSRLADLDHTLRSIMELPRAPGTSLNEAWVQQEAAPLANARVVVFRPLPNLLEPIADSNNGASRDVEDDPVAMRAVHHHGTVRGEVERGEERYAEAAVSVGPRGPVVLLSSSLHNDLQSVGVVQRRVVIAGAVAAVFAIVFGYVLATLFARRIRRLERGAERIADGRFDEPVVDDAPDELGQLARAFERMRLQLASLDRARRDFIANASHELRTPLFSIGGFLELLASEDLDPETRAEFLGETREQVSRLQKLATDLLDLSRLDAGRLAVARESFDLAAVGELLATEFGPRAAATDHRLEVKVDGPVPAIADEERVLQVGRVLVDNALAHTAPGSTVSIVVRNDDSAAKLEVADDGPGIPTAAQRDVFERFFRLDGTVGAGSGLGLAIAHELARLMEGRIELSSSPGSTRFTLVLPPDAFGQPAAAGKRGVDGRRGRSRRIAQV